jgi:hypothetical protein
MSDRIKGLIVHLDKDYREDDYEAVMNAIRMLKGVTDVEPVMVDIDDHLNRQRIKRELEEKLFKVLRDQ